ncbi:hypothetical protein M441DRAFT_255498 [Trichoderma asperellum CBS 433.97]|uniref:Hydrophobin n=1 Tax=Trichoderma asperellum (strain ATCC 204424 / CBS 433.97 / NBRC 101777) TaxID=1042311 RepID=A0A2T3YYP0_TRIA4|nr:hypothetical protein M441DRAFT_255498 [Trichoderma asperellum CBS 433.97]PTB37675.1 hypothetical protein M441DRAFT_255498 [Trichoderma asperellum CBS 433.97]
MILFLLIILCLFIPDCAAVSVLLRLATPARGSILHGIISPLCSGLCDAAAASVPACRPHLKRSGDGKGSQRGKYSTCG